MKLIGTMSGCYKDEAIMTKKIVTIGILAVAVVVLLVLLIQGRSNRPVDATGARIETSVDSLLPAMDAYGWFNGMPLSYSTEESYSDTQGIYYPVTERFDTYSDLNNYIRTVFSPEISNHLLNNGVYKDIDGRLCVNPNLSTTTQENTTSVIHKEVFTITTQTADRLEYVASVTYVSQTDFENVTGVYDYQFICENFDGQFLFTTFEYYY